MAACESPFDRTRPIQHGPTTAPGTSRTLLADWNDLDASLIVAMSTSEVALLQSPEEQRDTEVQQRTWHLVSIRDELLMVRASSRIEEHPTLETTPIEIRLEALHEARAGSARNTGLERRFLDAWARRLEQLAGKTFAPR